MCMAAEWILFTVGTIENIPDNTYFLMFFGHMAVVIWQFHHCATIALFAQRVHCLLYPATNVKKYNIALLIVLGVICLVVNVGSTYAMLVNLKLDRTPVPNECFSYNCMSSNSPSARMWSSMFVVAITTAITILGSFMLFLLHKHRKKLFSNGERKMNTFSCYVFYVRFVLTTIPFVTDLIVSTTLHIDLGKFLGPYGAVGSTMDYTIKTVVYYLLVREHNAITSTMMLNRNTPQ
ncbi:hypothetical protein QR680_010087 [Steinernema hermaphroditum]|uniref:Uncharacterized protein n=1 Tax=Steinernema hermaphroditum TaxID=289476 RepID=A0AA39MB25_9BILA|nr:hypothetical protein QR680_010087 [Steinernema hermaphroditum]